MPKYKQNIKSYKIVSTGERKVKGGHDFYGAFDLDDDGYDRAERHLRDIEDSFPHLDFEIIEG